MTNNENSTIVILPQEGVSVIDNNEYRENKDLVNVVIREGVTKIGSGAFASCPNLVSVKLPSTVEKIGTFTFQKCPKLREVTLPDSLSQMDSHVFLDCPQLKEMKIPDKITKLENSLFENCTSLEKVILPKGLEELPISVFLNATSLKEVKLPQSLKKIGKSAFKGCSSLTSIELPDEVKEIASLAFEGCTSLSKIKFSEKLEMIENEAFLHCTSLKQVEIPASVRIIEGNAFPKETRIIISPDNKNLLIKDQLILSANETRLLSCLSNAETIKIPSSVTTIGWGAFAKNPHIKTIVLPKNVKMLMNCSFEQCTSLQSVVMEEGVKEIGAHAFHGCSQLEAITFPETLHQIGEAAFQDCVSLKKLHISSKVDIDYQAFCNCSGLTELTITSNGKIESSAFEGCSNLVSIDVACQKINSHAFHKCTALTTVTLQKTVQTININAFDSPKLTTINLIGLNKTVDGQVFMDHNEEENLDVSKSSSWMEVSRDAFKEAFSLAKQGDPKAQKQVGDYYYNGEGVKKSYKEAAKYYLLSAQQGYAEAQWDIAYSYVQGEGVRRNYQAAIEWALKSEKQGYGPAQDLLGQLYEYGVGVTQDYETAAEWYRKAVKNGHKESQNALNRLLKKGLILPENANKLEDNTFGTLSHNNNNLWIGKSTSTFAGKEAPFDIELEGTEKEEISEAQRTAYANYLQQKDTLFEAVQEEAKKRFRGANKKKDNLLWPLALFIDRSGNYGWRCHREWGGEPISVILSDGHVQLAKEMNILYQYSDVKARDTKKDWKPNDTTYIKLFGVLTAVDIHTKEDNQKELTDKEQELLQWMINELNTDEIQKDVVKYCNDSYEMWCGQKITAKDLFDELSINSIYLNVDFAEKYEHAPDIFLTGECECDEEHGISIGFKNKKLLEISEEGNAF